MTPATSNTSSSSGVGISEDATLIRKAAEYFDAVGKREEARLIEAPLQARREATVVAVIGEVGCGKTMLVDALSEVLPSVFPHVKRVSVLVPMRRRFPVRETLG